MSDLGQPAACPGCLSLPAARAAAEVPDRDDALLLSVPGLRCAACMATVERGLAALPFVEEARVNLSAKRVRVSAAQGTSIEEIIAALDDLGYEAHPLDAASLGRLQDEEGRLLLIRVGLAGFAMMNVMLLSVAVWSGASDATRDLFHWISGAIALPVVVYAAQPFFTSAWAALRKRRLNMDVPISLAIVLAGVMSLYETAMGGEHAFFDAALSLTFFLLLGRWLDHRARMAARSAAQELTALESHTAQRLREGGPETVPVTDLVVGDRIQVPTGTRVPVDGALTGAGAVLDRSFLTGESQPVQLSKGDRVQAGDVNLGAPFRLRATHVGEDTTLRQMARLVEVAENRRNRYTALADKAAAIYAPVVHLLAFFAFLGWMFGTGDARLAINIAVATLIITCPCALGLAVPAVSTAASGALFSKGFLIKSPTALERLAEVTEVVFDKTGTLTEGALAIEGDQIAGDHRPVLKALADHSSHPVSKAVAIALNDVVPATLTDVQEIAGQGLTGRYNGQKVSLGAMAWLGHEGAGTGYRIDGRTVALPMREVLRPGAAEAVARFQAAGLPVTLLTGDAPAAAQRMAATLGIDNVLSSAKPDDKLRCIEAARAEGRKILMVGDGLNDTAALAAAHASVAPATALEAARSAADVVLLHRELGDLPDLVSMGRATRRRVTENFAIAAGYNMIAIPIALAGFATPLLAALAMSTSSITVLLNALRVRRASS